MHNVFVLFGKPGFVVYLPLKKEKSNDLSPVNNKAPYHEKLVGKESQDV